MQSSLDGQLVRYNHEPTTRKFHSSSLARSGVESSGISRVFGGCDCDRIRWGKPIQRCHYQGADDRCGIRHKAQCILYSTYELNVELGDKITFQSLVEQFRVESLLRLPRLKWRFLPRAKRSPWIFSSPGGTTLRTPFFGGRTGGCLTPSTPLFLRRRD